jgi:hypothetical protein
MINSDPCVWWSHPLFSGTPRCGVRIVFPLISYDSSVSGYYLSRRSTDGFEPGAEVELTWISELSQPLAHFHGLNPFLEESYDRLDSQSFRSVQEYT